MANNLFNLPYYITGIISNDDPEVMIFSKDSSGIIYNLIHNEIPGKLGEFIFEPVFKINTAPKTTFVISIDNTNKKLISIIHKNSKEYICVTKEGDNFTQSSSLKKCELVYSITDFNTNELLVGYDYIISNGVNNILWKSVNPDLDTRDGHYVTGTLMGNFFLDTIRFLPIVMYEKGQTKSLTDSYTNDMLWFSYDTTVKQNLFSDKLSSISSYNFKPCGIKETCGINKCRGNCPRGDCIYNSNNSNLYLCDDKADDNTNISTIDGVIGVVIGVQLLFLGVILFFMVKNK